MQIQYERKFFKDLATVSSKSRLQIETFINQSFSDPDKIIKLGKLEKLKGYQHYYKIRIGDYRIGIKIENDIISFERVLHRKEIYKKFP